MFFRDYWKLTTKSITFVQQFRCFICRFCKRHADYLNPDFSLGDKLPDHLEDRSHRFLMVLQGLIKEKCFEPSEIGCMDELPLILSPALRDKRIGSATTATGGILLKSQGLKGAQAIVFLAMTANGTFLPPFLILKVKYSRVQKCLCKIQPSLKC